MIIHSLIREVSIYILGEFLGSGRVTLYKNSSDQTMLIICKVNFQMQLKYLEVCFEIKSIKIINKKRTISKQKHWKKSPLCFIIRYFHFTLITTMHCSKSGVKNMFHHIFKCIQVFSSFNRFFCQINLSNNSQKIIIHGYDKYLSL